MPDVLPTFPEVPVQGIRAQLDLIYLFNPNVANDVIDKCNELLEELGELSNISGKIKPYAELEAPVQQYMPTTYGDGLYVANDVINVLPTTFNPSQWTLIATKIDRTAITQEINTAVGNEATARAGADNNLQSQIDAISASSDVKDIVGTYAELEDYDTSKLGNNDIIKVLQDETQNDATTYYRWSTTDEQFSLIGSEGPYYTKSQTDGLLDDKQDTLIAGEGITIENNVISSTGGTSGDFVPQYETMPEASSENLGSLVQYSGPTIATTKASATASQTVGEGLYGFNVDIQTFENTEQPSGDETVTFVASVTGGGGFAPVAEIGTSGNYAYFDTPKLVAFIAQYTDHTDYKYVSARHNSQNSNAITIYMNSGAFPSAWGGSLLTYKQITGLTDQEFTDLGITFSNYEYTSSNKAQSDWTSGTLTWTKDGAEVTPQDFGVTFTGTVEDGDEIEVVYTAAKNGYGHGYFYGCSAVYSDPSVIVQQTVGTDLYDLAIDLDTFVDKEHPTGDEFLNFTFVETPGTFDYAVESGFENISLDTTGIVNELVNQGYGNYVSNFTSGGIDRDENNGYVISVYSSRYWQTITMNVDSYVSGSSENFGRVANISSMSLGTQTWQDDNQETVVPSEYGITFVGDPVSGDVLHIEYTAPALLGYAWKNTNVQPTNEIEWTNEWKEDASGYDSVNLFAICDMLENGTYEWYYRLGTLSENGRTEYQTFRISFVVNNRNVNGSLNWIVDGTTSFNNVAYRLSDSLSLNFYRDNSNTKILIESLSAYPNGYTSNNPLFMCSDIKNVKTGDKFPVEISTTRPSYWNNMGTVYSGEGVNINISPNISGWSQYQVDQIAGVYADAYGDVCEMVFNAYYGEDRFIAKLFNVGTSSQNKKWVAKIERADGVLSNAYLAQNTQGNIVYLYHNITNENDYIFVQVTRIGMNVRYEGIGIGVTQDLPDGSHIIVCSTVNVGNTVTADNYGLIEQYAGPTNASYTNGYFYKAVGTPVEVPESMATYDISPNDFTVTVDATNLISAIVNYAGYSREYTINAIKDYPEFRLDWSADNETVTSVYWGAYGTFNESSGVPQLFNVSTTGTYYGAQAVYTYFAYTPAHTEIQNGHWEQIDVQPGGGQTIQYSSFPAASSSLEGTIGQYVGATDVNYTNGYFYKCSSIMVPASATGTQTAGSGLTDIAVNVSTYESAATTYNIDLTQPAVFSYEDDGIVGAWYYGSTEIGMWIDDIGITFDGTAAFGDEITVVYTPSTNTYAWARYDTQPSDFVPLSGGKMTGALGFVDVDRGWRGAISGYADGVRFGSIAQDGETITTVGTWTLTHGIVPSVDDSQNVGSSARKWSTVYAKKLNNGADIAVPTTGGTMVVAIPPTTPNTTWVLKATVDANGDAMVAWVQEV